MDTEDYTPDDQQVEDTYVSGVLEFISTDNEAKVREQFRRWLEAHDLRKMEQAWDEGAFTLSGEHPAAIEEIIRPAIRQANPYRKERKRQS